MEHQQKQGTQEPPVAHDKINIGLPRLTKTQWSAIFVGLLFVGSSAGFAFLSSPSSQTGSSSPAPAISGIQCQSMEGTALHIHPRLEILRGNSAVKVPAGIGIPSGKGCMYWLHTHDTSGTIHVESPVQRTFTLGEFLDIWDATIGANPIGGANVTVHVDGRTYDGDYRQIVFEDGKSILVEIA